MRFIYAGLGFICVALALVGVVLPLLPTVPFLLLATFFFANSSERLHGWIIGHPRFGPMIVDWQGTRCHKAGRKKGGKSFDRRRFFDFNFGWSTLTCTPHPIHSFVQLY